MTFAEIARANNGAIVGQGHYANMADGPEASRLWYRWLKSKSIEETGQVQVRKISRGP